MDQEELDALREWAGRIANASNPTKELHAFSLGVQARVMHEAAAMASEHEEDGEVAGILETHAQNCDKIYERACGE